MEIEFIFIFGLVLFSPFVFAGFFDFFTPTGNAPSSSESVTSRTSSLVWSSGVFQEVICVSLDSPSPPAKSGSCNSLGETNTFSSSGGKQCPYMQTARRAFIQTCVSS